MEMEKGPGDEPDPFSFKQFFQRPRRKEINAPKLPISARRIITSPMGIPPVLTPVLSYVGMTSGPDGVNVGKRVGVN